MQPRPIWSKTVHTNTNTYIHTSHKSAGADMVSILCWICSCRYSELFDTGMYVAGGAPVTDPGPVYQACILLAVEA